MGYFCAYGKQKKTHFSLRVIIYNNLIQKLERTGSLTDLPRSGGSRSIDLHLWLVARAVVDVVYLND